jgi:hypothetical protein
MLQSCLTGVYRKLSIMKKKGSTLLSLTFAVALLMPAIVSAQTGKVNFSGNWVVNTEKSKQPQGGGGRMGAANMTVTQEANLLTRTRTTPDGSTRVLKYTLDGKESVNSGGRGDSKSTTSWSSDGKKLTIVTKFNFDGNERVSTEVWSLQDAKTLTIESTRPGPNGEMKITLFYDKK